MALGGAHGDGWRRARNQPPRQRRSKNAQISAMHSNNHRSAFLYFCSLKLVIVEQRSGKNSKKRNSNKGGSKHDCA